MYRNTGEVGCVAQLALYHIHEKQTSLSIRPGRSEQNQFFRFGPRFVIPSVRTLRGEGQEDRIRIFLGRDPSL